MGFNLADVLKDVSNSDTGREQIEYIRLDLIDEDPNNFYKLSDVEDLAANIELFGLQQPIRVRVHPDNPQRYMIVSGHRRRAAVAALAKDDPQKWQEVSCIVQHQTGSAALQQLQLIFANSGTRKMTDAEIAEQSAQVERLLYQLKEEEGYEFPGRMRDHVAKVVGVSKSKLARLKVIRENLSPSWLRRFQNNVLRESTAYALAQLPPEYQQAIFNGLNVENRLGWLKEDEVTKYKQRFDKIAKLECGKSCGFPCSNMERKREQAARIYTYSTCNCHKCCSKCPELISCKNACPRLADKIKKLKEKAKYAKRQEKAAKAEEERPQIEQIQNLWLRFGYLRDRAGKTVKEVLDAVDIYYHKDDDKKYAALEDGTAKITTTTKLPYNYSCYLSDVNRFIAMADLFGCSLDYLLCRTDDPDPKPAENVSSLNTGWRAGNPEEIGFYAVCTLYDDCSKPDVQKMLWTGYCWKVHNYEFEPEVDGQILGWMPFPEVQG